MLAVDFGKIIDAYPPLDGLATIEQTSLSTGGSALNLAVDLRLLGALFDVGLLGAVADDENGAYIVEECSKVGVDTSRLRTIPGETTPFTDVMVERTGGRRTFFTHMGTNALFDVTPADLEASAARILYIGGLGVHPLMDASLPGGGNGWSELLEGARSAGMRTNMELAAFDPVLIAELAAPCLPLLDTVVINELEASVVVGADVSAPDVDGPIDWVAMEGLALALIDRGVSTLAVVHFPAGSVAADGAGRVWRQGSVKLTRDEVRSTTGAGDAFAAGVILGVHDGWPVEDALRLGAASAAACLSSQHTSAGIAPAQESLAQADRAGYRSTADGDRTPPLPGDVGEAQGREGQGQEGLGDPECDIHVRRLPAP
jgi:sugar/nucleoside kinase (ribokinase family)